MKTQCDVQAAFSFRHDRQSCVDFKGGQINSDVSVIALRQFDQRIGFTHSIGNCLHDDRHQSSVVHDLRQLMIQYLYSIVAGYEDQPDADGTDDPAHRQQQLIAYNGFSGQYIYHPLLMHEGGCGCACSSRLKPAPRAE